MAAPMVVSANGTTCTKQNDSILSNGHRGPREEISWYVPLLHYFIPNHIAAKQYKIQTAYGRSAVINIGTAFFLHHPQRLIKHMNTTCTN